MAIPAPTEQIPLTTDEHGVVRITGTRVYLETIVDDFNAGASPEEIVLSYPSLKLADVYVVIAYYLRNKDKVDSYIEEQDRQAGETRKHHQTEESSREIRELLISRQKK
ncbi:MAG TPA: DUF433 domain-containing protein [Meiothermus sp.]|jgi:uncharacterized protein (DUF433 family)|nr:DUF433 domain-containing protein [Meiothermus sp.]